MIWKSLETTCENYGLHFDIQNAILIGYVTKHVSLSQYVAFTTFDDTSGKFSKLYNTIMIMPYLI